MPAEALRRALRKLKYGAETCRSLPFGMVQLRSVWQILTAPEEAEALKHLGYAPVGDVPGLPRVLLLGDSISTGYTVAVRTGLKGLANVHRPPENCTHTRNALRRIESWLEGGKWDVIHFNFGLHDISLSGDAQTVSPGEYTANLVRLTDILRLTGARLAWATTTPLPHDLSCVDPLRGTTFRQRAADVDTYNSLAGRVMDSRSIPVNDLNGLSKPRLAQLQIANDIHFSKAGDAFLGAHTAAFLAAMLPAAAGTPRG